MGIWYLAKHLPAIIPSANKQIDEQQLWRPWAEGYGVTNMIFQIHS